MQWIYVNLQKWTPFSVIVLLAFMAIGFIAIWDTIHDVTVPGYIIGLLSLLLGGTGATSLVTHGANVANGTIAQVATLSEQLKQAPSVAPIDPLPPK